MKLEIRNVALTLSGVVPFEVGQIKGEGEIQIHYGYDGDEHDVDIIDYGDITYMGMKVEGGYDGYQKLRRFHKDLGIDIDQLINEQINKVLTPKVIKEAINNSKLGLSK